MDYDFVYTAKPVNAEAAKALQKGEHYDGAVKNDQLTLDAPLVTSPYPGPKQDNLTGRIFGRLTVIGYRGGGAKTHGTLWVVRCSCGRYATRRTKSIKNPKNTIDCCQYCKEIQYMKRHQYWKESKSQIKNR